MGRINDSWFEFNGVKSSSMGVRIMSAHVSTRGEMRGTQEAVSARNGYLWLSDGTLKAFDEKYTCHVRQSMLHACAAWLSGSGRLRFSHMPDAQYDARPIKAVEYKRITSDTDPIYEFVVTFTCQPYAYVYPPAGDIILTTSGGTLTNPGTAAALPRIAVEGSGYFSLTIGMQTLFFVNVTDGGVIVDSELGDALTLDGTLLANDKIDGDLFQIQPGSNVVSWLTGGENEAGEIVSGSVTKVTITPRWRYM